MIQHRWSLATVIALAALAQAPAALAQSDPMRLASVSMANQVGVMEYCMGKGWASQDAVDAQKSAAAKLPATPDDAGLDAARATGRKGELMTNGATMTMSSMAQQGKTTEQDLCSRMVASAKMAAARQSSAPSMPGMPGGATMPVLPPGMTTPTLPPGMMMPSIPGLPTPGAPKQP